MRLKENLIKLSEEYTDYPFKKKYTEVFIDGLDQLIDIDTEKETN